MDIKTKIMASGAAGMSKSDWKALFVRHLKEMAVTWKTIMLPRRFGPSGQNIYHLKQRTAKYVKRMMKLTHGTWKPLLKTGNLATTALNENKIVPKAGKLEVTVRIRRPHPTQKYVAEEVTRTNNNEVKYLMDEFTKESIAEASKNQAKEVK
jgi:hypothetical protein